MGDRARTASTTTVWRRTTPPTPSGTRTLRASYGPGGWASRRGPSDRQAGSKALTLWQGRFGNEGPADELMAFSVSLDFDRRLALDDLAGSRAHVRGLGKAGILADEDVSILLAALERV